MKGRSVMNAERAWKLRSVVLVLAAAGSACAGVGQGVPDRPEEIEFEPLQYDPPRAEDYRVTLDGGMVAYLVPDNSLPLVTVNVLMRLGPDQDPAGKEGLANLMMAQLTRGGTKKLSAEALEDRVAQLGAQLSSGMGRGGRGMMGMGGVNAGPGGSFASLNLLAKDLDAGLELLVDCLREPAFQEDRFELAREQALQRMKERNDSSAGIEGREWSALMRGEGHWTNRWTTEASLSGLTHDDLRALHQRYVGPANFLFAVSGNFDPGAMKAKLEKAFAGWPHTGERAGPPAAPASAPPSGWFAVDKDVNQARVSFGLPCLDRYDPDWYAALVMNSILGGGGFTSRLVNRIRSDEGLAYSVRASLGSGTFYPEPWSVRFQTKVRSTAFAIEVALTEIERIRDEKASEDELLIAKSSFVESFPNAFETAGAIAGALAVEEMTGRWQRDPDYFVEYRDRIRAVTLDDVQRVARRLLDPAAMTFFIVGDLDGALLGDPKHTADLKTMSGGALKRLPLRDPMTMQPLDG